MANITLNIDGHEVTAAEGRTILEAAREIGIDIPTLCHDERVAPYGACGLCVVEMAGAPRPVRACATDVAEGMVIRTDTARVRETRKTALELLLSDHTGDCRPPCATACPAGTDCQGYAGLVANGAHRAALALIMEKVPLPGSIGRVCPRPCEDACRRARVEEPVAIAHLKRFAADADMEGGAPYAPVAAADTGKRAAIIGGGPGGLSAAYFLRLKGHDVTVYDAMPAMGGMLRYGIPEYRLPKRVLDAEIGRIERLGARLVNGVRVGRDVSFGHIRETHDAVLVAVGAWDSARLGCPGEELAGVLGGIDFLRQAAQNESTLTGGRVAVVGGGNTAMDACRTALRLGAEQATVVYRRTRAEMPASAEEIREAEEEGVQFNFLTNPIEIIGENGRAAKILLQKMRLGEPDAGGRRRPVPVEGAEETLAVDTVIIAIGQNVNPAGLEGLALTKWNTVAADEASFATSLPGVFAIGDAVNNGAGIAIEAIGDAKRAAEAMDAFLRGEPFAFQKPYLAVDELPDEYFDRQHKAARAAMPHLPPEERKTTFDEVNLGFSAEKARAEAARCLECGCAEYFRCRLARLAGEYGAEPAKYAGEARERQPDASHPLIIRDSGKCILCGLCVRVCDEVMGRGALGLTNRGFDTAVSPALNLPLAETDCISCGQCVHLCPTGALTEALPLAKPVTLAEEETPGVCSFCGVGCETSLRTAGGLLLRCLPADGGLLCARGRFGPVEARKARRVANPLVRKGGALAEVSLADALLHISKKMQAASARYGSGALAVSVSDRLTNEEIFLVREYAARVLRTENVYCLNGSPSGLKDVFGLDAGTNGLVELAGTSVILLVCEDIMSSHAMAGLKVKRAVENGAKLILVSTRAGQADEWAAMKLDPGDNLNLLLEMAKALAQEGPPTANASGYEALAAFLAPVAVGEETRAAARIFGEAKNAMIVFDRDALTADAARLLADIAVLAGHAGRPRAGIAALRRGCNSQGLADMDVNTDGAALARGVERGEIRGLLVFGEDAPSLKYENLDFLAVADDSLTETAERADAVLPWAAPAESAGTYTSADRRMRRVYAALPPPAGLANWELVLALANVSGAVLRWVGLEDVRAAIAGSVPGYRSINGPDLAAGRAFAHGEAVLYRDGFATADGRARLTPPEGDRLFNRAADTNAARNRFARLLENNGLLK